MNRSILHDLYYRNLTGWERRPTDSPERREAQKLIADETEYIKKKLSEDDVTRLVNLHNKLLLTGDFDDYDAFCYGFRLGMQLIVEGVLVPVE